MNYKYRTGNNHKGAMVIGVILGVILILAIGYGISVLLCGLGLWALCKLGVIAAWTWKQAALWAIVIEVAIGFLRSIFGTKKSSD